MIPSLPMNECFSSAGALIEEFMKSTIQSNSLQKKKQRKHQIRIDHELGRLELDNDLYGKKSSC